MSLHDSLYANTAAAVLMQFSGDPAAVSYVAPDGAAPVTLDAIVGAIGVEQVANEGQGGLVQVYRLEIRVFTFPDALGKLQAIKKAGSFLVNGIQWSIERIESSSKTFRNVHLIFEADEELSKQDLRK